jgi:pimeloyl-ACP methyl ester carboxylesterase
MRRILTAAMALLILVATPVARSFATDRRTAATAGLVWTDCPAEPDAEPVPGQRCSTLRVPLDYRNPAGRQVTLTISRITAADPAARRGILLVNPGGPGGRGLVGFPGALAASLPQQVLDRFDLIGFDPRGLGASSPISCGLAPDTPAELLLPYPAPDGSIDGNVAHARVVARSCQQRVGDALRYITTANTARDMDRIRAALGERKLSYYGGSYGTYLGGVYATLFPDRGDRILLESAVDPKLVWYGFWRTWSGAVESRFPDFAGWAAARDDTYHLGADAAAVRWTYLRLAADLDRKPMTVAGRAVTGNGFRLATQVLLYSDQAFPALAEAWQFFSGQGGTPDAMLAVLAPDADDNASSLVYAIVCNDVDWPRDVAGYARNVAADRESFPLTAGEPANIWPCAFWPHRPVEPPVPVTDRGPRNILVLQNLRDPAAPWVSGKGMRDALGRRAALVTVDAGGHSVYQVGGACADAVATAFLADGVLPEQDLRCDGPRH